MLIDFEQVSAIQHTHYLIYYLQFPFSPNAPRQHVMTHAGHTPGNVEVCVRRSSSQRVTGSWSRVMGARPR